MTSNQLILKKQKVKIGSSHFWISSDDDYLKHISEDFEPDMCELFSTLMKPDFDVLDVGANIGCTTLLFSSLGRRVTSFEPSPSTFKILQKNISESNAQNITMHNVGLGRAGESKELTFSPNNRSGGFVSDLIQASAGHSIEKILIQRGDDLSYIDKFDFLKIGVEGYEKHVIEGMREKIFKNKPIVVCELNHWCLNAFQRTSVPDFFDFLLAIFPWVYAVDGKSYLNLGDQSQRYIVMYQHIINFRYPNLVAAFDEKQLENFKSIYLNGV